ncbi:MAG: Rpn family recombination-promoting nuclease/putative transposase, partial [Bacteroides sp.]
MSRFINPFTDYGFKKIFGQEVSKPLLIEFLNDLLEGERVIKDIQFLNNEQIPILQTDRASIYDIYCLTETGEHIIVEMQNQSQVHFKERALYYLSRAIINQGVIGRDWKFEIKAVYGVFLMNFLIDKETKFRTDVVMTDRESGEIFSDKLREIFIALPRFQKEEDECETDFERWIYVLNNMETLKRMPYKARKAVFQKLEEVADVASLNERERVIYDLNLKQYRDNLVVMESATQRGIEQGIARGLELGIKKGIEQGIEQGIEKG